MQIIDCKDWCAVKRYGVQIIEASVVSTRTQQYSENAFSLILSIVLQILWKILSYHLYRVTS